VVGVLAYLAVGNLQTDPSGAAVKTTTGGGVNLAPPTVAEQKSTESHKDSLAQSSKDHSSNSTTVQPVIVYAGQDKPGGPVFVSGYVSGVTEEGGSCILTFQLDGKVVTKLFTGSRNATTTSCGNMTVEKVDFTKSGSWSLTLEYKTAAHEGTSPITIVVVK